MGFPDLEFRALLLALDSAKVVASGNRALLRELGQRAMALGRQSADRSLKAQAGIQWAALERTLRRPQSAVRLLRQWVRRGEAQGVDPGLKAYALWNLGFSLRACDELDPAKKSFEKALVIFRRHQDVSGIIYALCGLAGVIRLLGAPAHSLKLYRRAYDLAGREHDPYAHAYTCCGMGNALRRLNRYQDALHFYGRSQKLYRRLADRVNEGYVRWGRFICRRALGETRKAQMDLAWAARIFKQERDERGLALLSVWAGLKIPGAAPLSDAALREAGRS